MNRLKSLVYSSIKQTKMKYLILLGLVITSFMASAENEKIVKSKIKKVTVYSQGAQVKRSASYSVGSGVTKIVIEGVSSFIDAKSLQVNATGSVILLDSKYSIFYPEPEVNETQTNVIPLSIRRKIFALEDSIFNMTYVIAELDDQINVLNATKRILQNNGAIKGQGKVNDSIPLLKEAIAFYELKMNDLNKKLLKFNKTRHIKNRKKTGMDTRLATLKNYNANAQLSQPENKGPVHRITITVQSENSSAGKINVSYLVSQAGWVPMYDLRSDASSGKINLNYKAHVYQNSGIDWENVRLSVSTNNPYQNKTKPTLHPWYVDYAAAPKYRVQQNAAFNAQPTSLGNTRTESIEDSYNESLQKDAFTSANFTEVIDHTISAEFKIDLPYSIKSNNEKHMVLVKNEDVAAKFKYYTVPKAELGVYLVAQISNLDELQLVPAKANIFFDGSYIGETYLNPNTMNDTLALSLGADPNIIVRRTLLKKNSKDKVIGSERTRTQTYQIDILNNKSRTIELVVQDQLPLTRNENVEIEATDLSKGKLNNVTGLVEWNLKLKPKEKEQLMFSYTVKHDKTIPVYLP